MECQIMGCVQKVACTIYNDNDGGMHKVCKKHAQEIMKNSKAKPFQPTK